MVPKFQVLVASLLQASKADSCLLTYFNFEELDPAEIFKTKKYVVLFFLKFQDVSWVLSFAFPTETDRIGKVMSARHLSVLSGQLRDPPEGGNEYCQAWNSLAKVVRSGWRGADCSLSCCRRFVIRLERTLANELVLKCM